MKNSKLFTAFLFVMTALQMANAQENNAKVKIEKIELPAFGVGLHIEQFRAGDLMNENFIIPANNIILTVNIKNVFRIEPEFGFASLHNDEGESSSKAAKFGVGMYGMFQKGNVNIYAGARIESVSIKSEYKSLYPYPTDEESKMSALGLGPVLGGEYFLSSHFSFGGNVMFMFSSLKDEDENKASLKYTSTGLQVKFYF